MLFLKLTYPQTVLFLLREGSSRGALPGNTDAFKTSSERLKKVATSYDQTRRRYDFWKKTSDLRHLEDVWFTMFSRRLVYDVLKTSDLSRLEDVEFETSWKRLIYDVFRMSDLRRLEDVRFMSSWRSPIYDVLKTSDLQRLQDVWFTASWRRLIYDILKRSILYCLKCSENFKCSSLGYYMGMKFCTNQWTGLYMVGASIMKEFTTLKNKFYRIRREERK